LAHCGHGAGQPPMPAVPRRVLTRRRRMTVMRRLFRSWAPTQCWQRRDLESAVRAPRIRQCGVAALLGRPERTNRSRQSSTTRRRRPGWPPRRGSRWWVALLRKAVSGQRLRPRRQQRRTSPRSVFSRLNPTTGTSSIRSRTRPSAGRPEVPAWWPGPCVGGGVSRRMAGPCPRTPPGRWFRTVRERRGNGRESNDDRDHAGRVPGPRKPDECP
jgi:hypothetical protein